MDSIGQDRWIKKIDAQLEEKTAALDKLKEEMIRLEILLHNYDDYVKWVEFVSILAEPGAQAFGSVPRRPIGEGKAPSGCLSLNLDSYKEKLSAFPKRFTER